MNKKFIRTTSEKFESVDKEQYKDCIIFIEDTKEIWMNGNYYARNDNEDSNILYDLETGLDLNGDQVKTINKLIIDQNGLVYSNNELVINNIKVNNTIIEKDDNGSVEIPVGDLNIQSDWNEEDKTSDAYIKNKPSIPSELTESTVSSWGFTKNTGTVTEIKMNNTSKGTSGIIDLGTVVTDAVVSQTATDASITDGVLTIPALMGTDGLNRTFTSTYEQDSKTLVLDSDLEDAYYNTLFVNMVETSSEIEPNKYYCWSEPVSTLTVTLKEPTNTNILNIYTIEFTTSDSGCTLILPQDIKWLDGEIPNIVPSTTYQISITNNLAIIQGFTYAE